MSKNILIVALLIHLVITVPALAQLPGEPPRERLGARVSFVGTASDLNDHFGHGYDFTLYFTERIWASLNLDVRIGATYLGDLSETHTYIAKNFLDRYQVRLGRDETISSEMRLAYLSLGPQYVWQLNDTQYVYGTLGMGIYTVSMVFDTGIQALDVSNQHLGGNFGGGFLWRIAGGWNIEANATAQMMWTGSDTNNFYSEFTNQGRNPLLINVGLGLVMDIR